MQLEIIDSEGRLEIRPVEHRIDAASAAAFKDKMRPHVLNPGKDIVLDLSQIDFLDSSGLGALIAVRKALHPSRKLTLRGLTANVQRVFTLTRMDQVFVIEGEASDNQQTMAVRG